MPKDVIKIMKIILVTNEEPDLMIMNLKLLKIQYHK